MFKKLKEKFSPKINKGLFVAVVAVVALLGGGFLLVSPQRVFATTYDAGQIQVSLGVGNNFYKVSPDTSVSVPVTLQLSAPNSLVFDGLSRDTLSGQWGGADLLGVGIGAVSKDKNNTVCQNVTSGFSNIVLTCDFPYASKEWSNTFLSTFSSDTWTKGQTLSFTVTIDSSFLNSLDLKPSDQGTLSEVYFYPYFDLVGFSQNPAFSPAKSVFLQVFSNSQEVQASTSTPAQLGVPGNGTVTSTPVQSPGGILTGIAQIVAQILGAIVAVINELLYLIFYGLFAPVIQALLSIRTYTDSFVGVIYPAWIIVRNVCDIMFIVAIIAIAMTTLFRIESYQYKHLLVQLLIAALLVNFSLVIGQAVLGIADTMQNTFLPNNTAVIRSLAQGLMVDNRSAVEAINFNNGATFASVVQPLFNLSLALGAFAVFAAIAAFLCVRVVALWILLMISPVAYVAAILPITEQYRKEWWKQFIHYAFFTPIMAFLLNIAAIILIQSKTNPVLQQMMTSSPSDLGGNGVASFVLTVGSNLIVLVFLFLALNVANKLGIMGGDIAAKWGKNIMGAPFKYAGKLTKAGLERGFEQVQNVTGVTMDPRQWAAKYKEYSEREKHKRLEKRADQDIGIGKFRIPGSAKIGLGSPMDFYKNYANWQGAKRMSRNLRMRTKTAFANMEHAKEHLDDLREQGNIMIADDFNDKDQRAKDAKIAYDAMFDKAKSLLAEKNTLRNRLKGLEAKEESGTLSKEEEGIIRAARANIAERDKDLREMGATKFEGPPGAERLLEDFAQETELKDAQVKQRELEAEVKTDNDKFEAYNNKRAREGKPAYVRQSPGDRETLKGDAVKALDNYTKAQKAYYGRRLPEAYHARAARQGLEAEEEKKVADIKNWPEKVQVFLTAQAESNPYLAAAALKSLAKDSNFNEIVEDLGYTSSSEGLKQFFEKEYRDKFGLTDHQMMQVATEVGYVNEDAGWWNMARVSQIDKHGHLNWQVDTNQNGNWATYLRGKLGRDVTEKDLLDYKADVGTKIVGGKFDGKTESDLKWSPQNNEIKVEMEKRGSRLIANFARTSFVNQTLGPEGHMSVSIHQAGLDLLQSMSKTQNTIYEFSRMLRPNTAKAIASAPEWGWKNYCKPKRIDREIYEKITKMAGQPLEPL